MAHQTRSFFYSVLAIGILGLLANAFAQPPNAPLPPGGQSILPPRNLSAFTLFGARADLGALSIVNADHDGFHQALQIKTLSGVRSTWLVQLNASATRDIKKGDVLLAHFWMRCVNSMTGEGYATFVLEDTKPPADKAVEFSIGAPSQWKEVFIPFVTTRDFPSDHTRVSLRLGFDRQTIQVGDIDVLDYGSKVKVADLPQTRITYAGRAPDAQWRKEALARIERFRKGDLDIDVTDSSGSPLKDAEVHAVLRKPAFGFGTCVDADLILGKTPDARRYRQTILALFNRAVFENEMKWQATWNGVPPDVDEALQWLLSHGITVRGHNLVWPSWRWLPDQLQAYKNDPKMLREITARHITYMVSHFRGKLVDWDVVNEPYTNYDLIDALGGKSIMVNWFKLAHEADPKCRLFLNDFGILDGGASSEHRDDFYNNIHFLLTHGAPIGGIGIQSHFGTILPAPESIVKIIDHFSSFGLPIESTELSLSLHDKQLQADYLRDYMIAMFSEPKVRDIMLWGFWQGRHWRPEAGLYDVDWTPEPAAAVWINLTQKQWTTDTTVRSDDRGHAAIHGFYGSYDIGVTAGGQTNEFQGDLRPGGSRVQVRMN